MLPRKESNSRLARLTETEREIVERGKAIRENRRLCPRCGGKPLRRYTTYGAEWFNCPRCNITWSNSSPPNRHGARFYLEEIRF
ncbi:MAG: hypothetical protein ACE5GD_07915 [Candidatus Geothermarchaeales archaeon]